MTTQFNRHRNSAGTTAAERFSQHRRRLLQLGMALGGFALARRVLHLPPHASDQTFMDNGLSRHEAAFYSSHRTKD